MNQLKVVSIDGKFVTDSREVAKVIGKEHKELLRTIRQYVGVLTSAKMRSSDFFIPNYYQDAKKEQRPCFLLTRKGCDMVANKMTGEKGVLFTAEYVTRFEEMEKQIHQPMNQLEILQSTVNQLVSQDRRITNLEETMRIDGGQEFQIRKRSSQVVIKALGGKETPAYDQLSRKVFSEFWRDFKNHFNLPRYGDLPKKQYDDGLRFIGLWQPSTGLRIEIENTNKNQSELVI